MKPNMPFNVVRKNVPKHLTRDYYHDLLMLSWPKTMVGFFVFLTLTNAFFGTLYWLDPYAISDSDGSWLSCFFFSVQTLGTIGYGQLSPQTLYAHILVTTQAGLGLIIFALLTGLLYAKFARPFAKIEFSRNMVITTLEGKQTLMFRMVNIRKNQIIDNTVSLIILKDVKTEEGHTFRRFTDLKLVRSKVPFFTMSMTIMHIIDESSPLYHMTPENCNDGYLELIVTAIGTDSTYGQPIHSNHVYRVKDIVWNKRFKDIVTTEPDGTRVVDFGGFHEIV